jgi:hypothetical protein
VTAPSARYPFKVCFIIRIIRIWFLLSARSRLIKDQSNRSSSNLWNPKEYQLTVRWHLLP